MKTQFSMCKNCKFDKACCKIVPPMVFEFERATFRDYIIFDNFQDRQISLLKKIGKTCVFLKNGKCQIYNKRPFNCKMFPLDVKKINKKLCWILWEFCYTPKNIEQNLASFEKIITKITKNELYTYIAYTKNSSDFQNLKFKILRKVKCLEK